MVLKSLVASQPVYILTPLQTKHQAIKETNRCFLNYLYGMIRAIK